MSTWTKAIVEATVDPLLWASARGEAVVREEMGKRLLRHVRRDGLAVITPTVKVAIKDGATVRVCITAQTARVPRER